MLPGLGFSEILVLGVLALLVVGPKDLPMMLRELGKFTRKLQSMANEFRSGFDELARQAELDELRKEVDAMRQSAMIPDVETILTAPPDTEGLAPSITGPEGETPPPSDGGAAAELPNATAEHSYEPAPVEAPLETPLESPLAADAAKEAAR